MSKQAALPDFMQQRRIIRIEPAAEFLGYSVAHLRRLYQTGKIPKPKSIGGRALGWEAHVLMSIASGNSATEAK